MVRIVCIGNRLIAEDSLGPRVHDRLAAEPLPAGVELVEGGIAGLRLLGVIEGAARVVFVDSVVAEPGAVVTVDGATARLPEVRHGHAEGLAYLLGALPHVCEGAPPAWSLVGAAGAPDEATVARVAAVARALAAGGAA